MPDSLAFDGRGFKRQGRRFRVPSPRPLITSITPVSGVSGGGTSITDLHGTNFVPGATVKIGGVDATGVAFVSSVKLTCVTPAGTVGAQDVLVTNPDQQNSGSSGAGLFTYTALTPPTSPSAWWRDSYGGDPWTPVTAGPGNLVTNGVAPSVGAATNAGLTPAQFNGTTQGLKSAQTPEQLTSAASPSNFDNFTVVIFFRNTSPGAAAGAFYDDPTLISDSGSHWGVTSTSSGVRAGAWGGGTDHTAFIPLASGAYAMAVMRWDGTNVKCLVSQASGTTENSFIRVAGAGIQRASGAGTFLIFGVNYSNAARLTGTIDEIILYKRSLSAPDMALLVPYFNSRYNKGLT